VLILKYPAIIKNMVLTKAEISGDNKLDVTLNTLNATKNNNVRIVLDFKICNNVFIF
jgi:hypothetical protein